MQIIIKYLLKNMREKKFRTFLILFSIIMSSALFFASTSVSDNIVKMFLAQAKQYYGSSDIIIVPNEKSPTPFFRNDGAKGYEDRTEYVISAVQGIGQYKQKRDESVTINMLGTCLEDLEAMNPIILENELRLYPFKGNKIIISKNTSEKYGLKIGSNVELEINSAKYRFQIAAIAHPSGFFLEGGQSNNAVIPKDTFSTIYGAQGLGNITFIKLKDKNEKQQVINQLSGVYKRYTVKEPVSEEEMRQQTASISVGFLFMTVLVLFMSVFIIYTSFKVITMERLPIIGTFRSIGASKRMSNYLLLAESTLYGLIGGIIGCLMGIGILYLITLAITPPWMKGYHVDIKFTAVQLAGGFLLALVLSFISSFMPIKKVSSLPLKEIVLNMIEKHKKRKPWRPILGIAFLAAAFAVPRFTPKGIALPVDMACIVLSTSAIVLLIPYLVEGFVKLFERIYVYIFGNEGTLAAKNLRENKSILNNISLLAIGISSLLMINTLSSSVITEVANFFTNNSTFEIWMYADRIDRDFERLVQSVEGVKGVYGNYEVNGIEVSGKKQKISVIQGINTTKYLDYLNTDIQGDRKALIAELDKGRNIMITNMLKESMGYREGDYITLKMKQGLRSYKIIGFYNTLMDNGNNALISDRFFKMDTGIQYYNNLFIKAENDPALAAKAIIQKFARLQPYVKTTAEIAQMNSQMNAKVFNTMKAFSIMTMIIGIFGIFNNFVLSFIERRRSLAMLRSIGMQKRQIMKMMFIEALTGGLIGGILGVLTGILMLSIMPFVMKAMNEPIPIHYSLSSMLITFAFGAIITLIASISHAIRSSKLNIIQSLKYE